MTIHQSRPFWRMPYLSETYSRAVQCKTPSLIASYIHSFSNLSESFCRARVLLLIAAVNTSISALCCVFISLICSRFLSVVYFTYHPIAIQHTIGKPTVEINETMSPMFIKSLLSEFIISQPIKFVNKKDGISAALLVRDR